MAELSARIIAKASATAGEEPVAGDLEVAELAVNTADGKLFTKHTDNSVVTISGGGGGGAASLDDLADVTIVGIAPTFSRDFEPGTYLPNNALGQLSTEQAHTGTQSFKGTGNYGSVDFGSVLKSTNKRYDCWSVWVYPTQDADSTYRIALGGTRPALGTGPGYAIYTRDTGFGLYSGGGFVEVGTRPTIAAGQWHHFFVQVDFGSNFGLARGPANVSIWVDGAIAVNNVAWTREFTDYETLNDALNFSFTTGIGTAYDKYFDDLRLCQVDTPIVSMTEATITPATVDAAIDAIPAPFDYGMALIYDGQEWVPGYSASQPPKTDTIPVNSLQGVTLNGRLLSIDGLGTIPFSDDVDPSVTFYGIYDHSVYGMTMAAYEIEGAPGALCFAHETKGYEVKLPASGYFRIAGPTNSTTNTPELRFETGNATDIGGTGSHLGFKLPAGYSVDQTYTLPLVDGNAGDVLQTNGSGVLSFVTARTALGIGEYADDAAAGTGGVASGAMYYNTTSGDYRMKS